MSEAMAALGRIAQGSGAFDKAREWREQELALRRVIGDEWGIAKALGWLSYIAQHQRQPEESERLAQESMAMFRDIGDEGSVAGVLANLGNILLVQGEPARTEALLRDSPAIHSNFGMVSCLSTALLGRAQAQIGRYAKARELELAALALARESGYGPHTGLCCWLLGYVAVAEGDHAEAQRWLEESVTTFRANDLAQELSWALVTLAFAERGQKQNCQARQHLVEALAVHAEVGTPVTDAMVFAAAALLLLDEREVERAAELYALAKRHPIVANSQWFEDVAGVHIATAAETLPPDVVAAAQERGRARDLEATVKELLADLEAKGHNEGSTAES